MHSMQNFMEKIKISYFAHEYFDRRTLPACSILPTTGKVPTCKVCTYWQSMTAKARGGKSTPWAS